MPVTLDSNQLKQILDAINAVKDVVQSGFVHLMAWALFLTILLVMIYYFMKVLHILFYGR